MSFPYDIESKYFLPLPDVNFLFNLPPELSAAFSIRCAVIAAPSPSALLFIAADIIIAKSPSVTGGFAPLLLFVIFYL